MNTVDTWADQFAALAELRPAPTSDLLDEPARWVYYPWRATVLKLLGPRSYRRLRLDRNRHLATSGEQDRLGRLRIGIVGLSSGHLIAHSLAVAGFCGELRLTDFDTLGVSISTAFPQRFSTSASTRRPPPCAGSPNSIPTSSSGIRPPD